MMPAIGPRKVARYFSTGFSASPCFPSVSSFTLELEDIGFEGAGVLAAESLETTAGTAGKSVARVSSGSGSESVTTIDVMSRSTRCNSARMSAACWKRSLRSFSSARLMMCSSCGGKSGFSRTGATGAR